MEISTITSFISILKRLTKERKISWEHETKPRLSFKFRLSDDIVFSVGSTRNLDNENICFLCIKNHDDIIFVDQFVKDSDFHKSVVNLYDSIYINYVNSLIKKGEFIFSSLNSIK